MSEEKIKAIWSEINTYYAQTLEVKIKVIWPEIDVGYLQPIAESSVLTPIIIAVLFIVFFYKYIQRQVKLHNEKWSTALMMGSILMLHAFWLLSLVLFIILERAMPQNDGYSFETPQFAINSLDYLVALIPADYVIDISFQETYYPSMFLMGLIFFFVGMSITYLIEGGLPIPRVSTITDANKAVSAICKGLFMWPLAMMVKFANRDKGNYYNDF